jgi:hypothetical protein
MTNQQFYFAIGLPILSILIVWLGSTLINGRESKALRATVEGGFAKVEVQILGLRESITLLTDRVARLENRFDKIDDEIRGEHVQRLTRLESRVFSTPAA